MKVSRFIFLLCFVIISACSKQSPADDVGGAIAFSEPTVGQTKSALIRETVQMQSGINELAYSVFASRYIPSQGGSITTHEQFMDNVKVHTTLTDGVAGTEWSYDMDSNTDGNQSVYWTIGAAHKFFAAYPYYDESSDDYDGGVSYEIDEEKHALKVTKPNKVTKANDPIITGLDNSGKNICPDILYGTILYDKPYSILDKTDKVRFDLNHALAAVSFKITNGMTNQSITSIEDMSMTGIMNSADQLYLSEDGAEWPAWEELETDNSASFNFPDITGISLTSGQSSDLYTALVIPQNFAQYVIDFTFKVKGVKYEIKLSDYKVGTGADLFAYISGNHYIYNFDVTSTDITCTLSVVPWIADEIIELN